MVNGKRYEYTYNADGMRTCVKVYENNELNNVYYYIWENGKITGYYISNSTETSGAFIKMLFDGEGDPIGFEMNESNEVYYFYFRKNIQGDITAVCESDGNELIRYYYDAWGGVAAAEEGDNPILSVLALICTPITYRGYNYDAFTGLYYLQSRYYNATYGRFLNADDTEILEATQGTPLGANLFAYCNNNPVNGLDYTGNAILTLTALQFIGMIVVAVVSLIVIISFISNIGTENKYYNLGALQKALYDIYDYITTHGQDFMIALATAASLAFIKGFNNKTNDHHIIAENSPKADIARLLFAFVGGNVNDPRNIVTIRETFHQHLHTDLYYGAVNALISKSYYFPGIYDRETSVYNMLWSLKTILTLIDFLATWG